MPMPRRQLAATTLALVLGTPAAALAGEPSVFLDLWLMPKADLDLSIPTLPTASVDGTGFGGRIGGGRDGIVVYLEAQGVDYDIVEDSVATARLGAGFGGGNRVKVSGRGEIVSMSFFGADVDGFGFHLRAEGAVNDSVTFYGQAGLLTLEDAVGDTIEGTEYTVGATFAVSPSAGVLLELHSADLEEDWASMEMAFDELRAGAHLVF